MYKETSEFQRGDNMTHSRPNDIQKAISGLMQTESVRKFGRFRALLWQDVSARQAASELMLKTPAENRDNQFWDKYYGYCVDVYETPNVAVLDGLAGLLCWGAGISTSVQKFSNAYTFLGVGNGLVVGQLAAAFTADGSADSISVREVPSNYTQNNYNTYTTTIAVLSCWNLNLIKNVTGRLTSSSVSVNKLGAMTVPSKPQMLPECPPSAI